MGYLVYRLHYTTLTTLHFAFRQPNKYGPGSRFPEGITTVTYTATDNAGISQQCDIHVKVKGRILF